jgi:hypothetical protein
MFPDLFKKPQQKLLLLNKMYNSKIPIENLNIIKDFAFYNSEKMPFIKNISAKKREPHLIKLAWSRNNLPPWQREERFPGEPTKIITETSSRWLFGFTYDNIPSFNLITPVGLDIFKLQMQGENCVKCGEYTYLCYSYKPHLHSKLSICFCRGQ